MNFDVGGVEEVVRGFWDEYGYALAAGASVLVVALVVTAVVTVVKSKQRDRYLAGVTALVVLAWTSEGLWEVARFTLGLPLGFAVMTFFVYEAMMLTCALQAERYRRNHPSPGPAGRYMWVLACTTATIVAFNAETPVEALLRFTLPLAAAGLWWVGITADRDGDSDELKQLREAERAHRDATWAISWRRLLVAIGVMRPGAQKLSDAERQRRIRQMVAAANRLRRARPGSRCADRARRRLEKLAELASVNDIATVRAKVARTARIFALVITAADPQTTDEASAPHRRSGHASRANWLAPGENGSASPGAESDVLDGTAPFQPDPPPHVSGNGVGAVEHQPAVGAPGSSRREVARRVYEDSVRKGRPLSSRAVARFAGCSPTTAWRAIRAVTQPDTSGALSPNEAPPPTNGVGTQADTPPEV